MTPRFPVIMDDGGMSSSIIAKPGGCCMARAIAICTGLPFGEIWQALADCNARTKAYEIVGLDPENMSSVGIRNLDGGTILGPAFMRFMRHLGFKHTSLLDEPVVKLGPWAQTGRIVCTSRDHAFALVGGVIHDMFDIQDDTEYQLCGIYHYWRHWY